MRGEQSRAGGNNDGDGQRADNLKVEGKMETEDQFGIDWSRDPPESPRLGIGN